MRGSVVEILEDSEEDVRQGISRGSQQLPWRAASSTSRSVAPQTDAPSPRASQKAKAASMRSNSHTTRSATGLHSAVDSDQSASSSQEVPSFAAFPGPASTSYPTRSTNPNVSPIKSAPTSRARPVPKKNLALSKEEQERLHRQREQEEEQDDFFTTKATITFKNKSGIIKKALPRSAASLWTASKATKPTKAVVVDLDDEEESSSTSTVGSSTGNLSDGRKGSHVKGKNGKGDRKIKNVSRSPTKSTAPIKRPMPSSSSSSSDSQSDSSQNWTEDMHSRTREYSKQKSTARNGGDAHEVKKSKKGKDWEREPQKLNERPRSLSPIVQVDTFAVSYALQNLRRNAAMIPPPRQTHLDDRSDFEELTEGMGRTMEENNHRSRSISVHRNSVEPGANPFPQQRLSMTPLAEEQELTEEEKDAKFGPWVSISVGMVHDPRIPVTDQNRRGVTRYCAPLQIKLRARENFDSVFGRVSSEKGIERHNIAITYNDRTVFTVGTPYSLGIISHAIFKAYSRNVFDYLHEKRELDRQQQWQEGHRAQLEAIASAYIPGKRLSSAIDLDGHSSRGGSAQLNSNAGDDSEIEIVGLFRATTANAVTPGPRPEMSTTVSKAAAEDTIRLRLRGGPTQQILVAVPKNRTISALIKHYLKKAGLDVGLEGRCRVDFDGEELSHASRIDEQDFEDEEILDIKIPT